MPADTTPESEPAATGAGATRVDARCVWTVLGWIGLATWLLWWAASLAEFHLVKGESTWISVHETLGLDFFHNFAAASFWVKGKDPFHESFGDIRGTYGYAPAVLPFFFWCAAFGFRAATGIWIVVIAAMVALGAYVSLRIRERLRLRAMPAPLGICLALIVAPAVFAMERGQCDILVLALLLIGYVGLRRRNADGNALVGTAVALAIWVKAYPILALFGLLALRRFRAVIWCVVAFAIIGGMCFVVWPHWLSSAMATQQDRVRMVPGGSALVAPDATAMLIRLQTGYAPIEHQSHSIASYWPTLWTDLGATLPARIPGPIAAAMIFAPVVLWVSLRVWAARPQAEVAYLYLLWLVITCTFVMPVSFDYNLIYAVPLALAVWPRRRSAFALASGGCMFIWLQPWFRPLGPDWFLLLKVLSLHLLAVMLVRVMNRQKNQRESAVS